MHGVTPGFIGGGGPTLASGIDLLGCEYLGGCPTIGSRVLNKVELHIDADGVTVAIAPQGLFTPAAARPVLSLRWSEITTISVTNAQAGHPRHLRPRLVRAVVKVATMRLDLADQLVLGTAAWTMTVGVRVSSDELTQAVKRLLTGCAGPTPAVPAP